MPDDGHVFGAVAFSETGLVVAEDDIEHPVQLVFDAPVASDGLGGGLGREALPSMATKSGRSGQVSRTQAVKQAENRPVSSRFISKVSQRPPGTP